jgi:hypothetical protein
MAGEDVRQLSFTAARDTPAEEVGAEVEEESGSGNISHSKKI